jgi:hypothetical protein
LGVTVKIDINSERYIKLSTLNSSGLIKRLRDSETTLEDKAIIESLLRDEGLDVSNPDNIQNVEREGFDEEVATYLATKTVGVSRLDLNIFSAIGVVVFGWLLILVYGLMGQKKNGAIFAYGSPICVLASFLMSIFPYPHMNINSEILLIAGGLLYSAGWIHANVLLSRCKSVAREKIGSQSSSSETDNIVCSLLKIKYLRDEQGVIDELIEQKDLSLVAAEVTGAAAQYLQKRDRKEAIRYLDAAMASSDDQDAKKYRSMKAKLKQ